MPVRRRRNCKINRKIFLRLCASSAVEQGKKTSDSVRKLVNSNVSWRESTFESFRCVCEWFRSGWCRFDEGLTTWRRTASIFRTLWTLQWFTSFSNSVKHRIEASHETCNHLFSPFPLCFIINNNNKRLHTCVCSRYDSADNENQPAKFPSFLYRLKRTILARPQSPINVNSFRFIARASRGINCGMICKCLELVLLCIWISIETQVKRVIGAEKWKTTQHERSSHFFFIRSTSANHFVCSSRSLRLH